MAKTTKKGVAFYKGSSWYHRMKVLQEDGTVKYGKRGGFQSQAEAEKSYYEHERQFKEAYRAYQITSKPDADIGFKDYLIYWFEEIFVSRVENTTHMVCAYALYDLILPHMEQDIKLRYVNAEYLDALLAVVSKSSESAGNKSRELLNLALKEAVVQGYIRTNPVLGTKVYTRKKPTVIVLGKENIKILLSAASKTDWYLEILLALFCGLRKGEIQGLKFQDFDPVNKTIHIQRQVTANPRMQKGSSEIEAYGVVEKPPKTDNSYRILRVPEVIVKEIELRQVWVAHNKEAYGETYVDRDYISCQGNGMPHSASAMNAALTRICKKNGLPHITVHGLRHMYATILIERNVPLVKISALLGHSSVNTTFEYYCDVMDENEQIISFMNSTFIPEGGETAC
jgi:integrase